MKSFGNLILMALICIVIFWIFMALRPAHADYVMLKLQKKQRQNIHDNDGHTREMS